MPEPQVDNCELTTYIELADILDALPMLVREKRRRDRISLRGAATQLGVAASTLARFETSQGGIASDTVTVLVRWLGNDITRAAVAAPETTEETSR